jgi:molybdenum cofactor cytidylyltransferase
MKPPVVLVLASGRGERFAASGGAGSKLQAMLGGQAVLARTLAAVRASGLAWHVEDAGHPGMGDSIAAAVRATPDAGGWLVLPGDLPLVQVGFSAACRDALLDLKGDFAAAVLRAQAALKAVALIDVTDEGTITDIDTLEDLRRAEALLAQR